MSGLLIRLGTLEDTEAINALLQASYPVLLSNSYEPAILDLALPFVTKANPVLLRSGTYYLCSLPDGLLAGCGGWSLERPGTNVSEPGLAHIRHFATHADRCGRGIGRAIYDRCEREAKALGISEFECHASRNAEGFYRALGFRTVEPMQIPFSPGVLFPALLMKKTLL